MEVQALWDTKRVEVAAKTSAREIRYAILGKIANYHHTVIITCRGANVRIISARRSSEREIQIYEKYKK